MVGADLVRFGVFAALPFTTSATQIVALAAVAGIATGFFRPAAYAGLPNLVRGRGPPERELAAADGRQPDLGARLARRRRARRGLGRRTRPTGSTPCTFLISAVFLCGIPQRLLQASAAASRGHWRDLKDGFALTVRSKALLTVLVAWNVAMFSNAAVNVAEPRLACQRLRRRARSGSG